MNYGIFRNRIGKELPGYLPEGYSVSVRPSRETVGMTAVTATKDGGDRVFVGYVEDMYSYYQSIISVDVPTTVRRCRRCGGIVVPEEDPGLRVEYPYFCKGCNENMYRFETEPDKLGMVLEHFGSGIPTRKE